MVAAACELTSARRVVQKQNAQLVNARDSFVAGTRHLNRGIAAGYDIDKHISNAMAAQGMETEEQEDQRMKIEAMPIECVKDTLQQHYPEIRRKGSRRQLRYWLLCATRGQLPAIIDDEEEDNEAARVADEEVMRLARLRIAEMARDKANKELRQLRKPDKKDVMGTIDQMKEVYAEQLNNMDLKVDDLNVGDIVVGVYGTVGGVVGDPGQGSTPGMPRSFEIIQKTIPGGSHLIAVNRLEAGGRKLDNSFRMYNIEEVDKYGVAKISKATLNEILKKGPVSAAAGSAAGSGGPSTGSAAGSVGPSTGSAASSAPPSELSTPRPSGGDTAGTEGGAAGTEGGTAGTEGGAAGTEGATAPASAGVATLDNDIAVFNANGRRLYGGARIAFLKKQRTV